MMADLSERIVNHIARDIEDRCRLGDEWTRLDQVVRRNIRRTWAGLVRAELKELRLPGPSDPVRCFFCGARDGILTEYAANTCPTRLPRIEVRILLGMCATCEGSNDAVVTRRKRILSEALRKYAMEIQWTPPVGWDSALKNPNLHDPVEMFRGRRW